MKYISMWEPYATLFVSGLKRIETRGWYTDYRGWLAVYATRTGLNAPEFQRVMERPEFRDALADIEVDRRGGRIIGAVYVIACHPIYRIEVPAATSDPVLFDKAKPSSDYRNLPGVFEAFPELNTVRECAFGHYDKGRFGIVTAHAVQFEPIPFRARQGKLIDLPELQAERVGCNLPRIWTSEEVGSAEEQ